MSKHRSKVRQGKTSTIYSLMRDKGLNNFKYVQVASCVVESIDEQRQFEQHWIDESKPTLNTIKAFATEEDNQESNRRSKQRPEYKTKQKEYMQEYQLRPEVIDKRRGYRAKPEVKQKRTERKKKPEYKTKQKLYKKEYEVRPEIKAKRRETNAKPEVKQKKREYQKRIHRVCICG